ncbi:MAG: hypothetical protein MZU95_09720 [Desulfomicrobium escambiense]|nr:hypothetical protein [Desulfomicrobium escambiense]
MLCQNALGHVLVHGNGRCHGVASHTGDPGKLEKPLDGAVFAPRAVEHREHGVYWR